MNRVVVDSSVLAARALHESGWEAWAARLLQTRPVVPALLPRYEVSNAIAKSRGFSAAQRAELTRGIWRTVMEEIPFELWISKAVDLATQFTLSFTDSSFVSVALLWHLPLWTLDRRQAETARAAGVAVERI